MKNIVLINIISLFILFSGNIYAGTIDGNVRSITYAKNCSSGWNGCVIFTFDTNINNPASCQWSARSNRMALDYNGTREERDKIMIDVLTLAFENNFRVTIKGYGICDIHGNTESIQTVTVYRD